jgi:hypothetical protein
MNCCLQTCVGMLFTIGCFLTGSSCAGSETRGENREQWTDEERVQVSVLDIGLHEDQAPFFMNLDVNEDIFDFEGRPFTIEDLVELAVAPRKKNQMPLVIDLILHDDEEKHFEMRVAVKVVRKIGAATRKLGKVTVHLYVKGLWPKGA